MPMSVIRCPPTPAAAPIARSRVRAAGAAPGPLTRLDLGGIMFSLPAPGEPPVTLAPHLVVIVRCRADEPGEGILEVVFKDEQGEEVARNASPFTVEPGKFTYRLVRGELT